MSYSKTLYGVVFIAIINVAASKQLPAFVKTCHMSDPELGTCLKDRVESLRPHLRTGIPSFKIAPIDPYVIPFIRALKEGLYDVNLTDVRFTGLNNFDIIEMNADPEDLSFSVKINLEKVDLDSRFKAIGKFVILFINGHGNTVMTFTDVAMTIDIQCARIKKGNKTHLQVKDVKVDLAPKKMSVVADNAIDGNPQLSQAVVHLINDNYEPFFEIAKPSLVVVAQEALKSSISYVFEKWTMDELFPK